MTKTMSTELLESNRVRSLEWYRKQKDDPAFLAKRARQTREWRGKNPEKRILRGARDRARDNNLPFNLEVSDIIIPEECPILKNPFVVGTQYAPSLDRIVPELGYVKGNVWVISRKANAMKQDATIEELRRFAEWAKTFQI